MSRGRCSLCKKQFDTLAAFEMHATAKHRKPAQFEALPKKEEELSEWECFHDNLGGQRDRAADGGGVMSNPETLQLLQAWLKTEVEKLAAEANAQDPHNYFEAQNIKIEYTKAFAEILGKGLYRVLDILIKQQKEGE